MVPPAGKRRLLVDAVLIPGDVGLTPAIAAG